MATRYTDAVKRRIILDYIKENKRSPSREQIFESLINEANSKPGISKGGFSSYDVIVPSFQNVSSSEMYNANRSAFHDDIVVIGQKLSDMIEFLEGGHRSFLCTANRCKKINSMIEAKLNNLLMLSGRTDLFVHGIEETFDSSDSVDLENSTVQVNPGYVTLRRGKHIKKNISGSKFSLNVTAPQGGFVGSVSAGSLKNVLEEDGIEWKHLVHTKSKIGRVNCIITINFEEEDGIEINDLRLTGMPSNLNSEMFFSIYYSTNGDFYNEVQPKLRKFEEGENLISIGKQGVKGLRIILSKRACDYDHSDDEYVYLFSLDSIEIINGKYSVHKESVLYAGPYFAVDDSGNDINFSLANLSHGTCCIIPEKTSVQFWLSKDNETWYPVSFRGDSLSTVQFNTINSLGSWDLIDSEKFSKNSLIFDPDIIQNYDLSYDFGKEVYTNVYINSEFSERFVLQNTSIKRNLPQFGKKLYGISSGWFREKETLMYKTTVRIESFEGVILDLGSTSAYLNEKLVTGSVYLPKGFHTFATSAGNWMDVPTGLNNIQELKDSDPLYPYNHKLIVEGYNYLPGFTGDRIYNGLGSEYFGSLLKYVTPERFSDSNSDRDLNIYTIEENNGNIFFKIKTDENDASWKDEKVEVRYMLRLENTNTLYVKALLRTRDTSITPNINKIQVRVI